MIKNNYWLDRVNGSGLHEFVINNLFKPFGVVIDGLMDLYPDCSSGIKFGEDTQGYYTEIWVSGIGSVLVRFTGEVNECTLVPWR
jgi:hypothetical protein